ncbi:STAS domain-containing protein [Domibacillus epiphyticus]|uniref:Anti-anti-sigma factor n=1 Tax=Domibacillus epiphyticus TaxID=1714355 RepID=A0A1V2A7C8_9BACI|nr:STAS domain-containing protein [Domibacillus epiphyticus]OMP66866.1 anti-anti-sigma factor [Domibacillus epiphyticus]
MNSIETVAAYLIENAESLAGQIVDDILSKFQFDVPKGEIEQAVTVYTEFIEYLGEAITSEDEKVPKGLLEWSKKNGEREASLMGRISSVIERYPETRLVFIKRMTAVTMEHGLATGEVAMVNRRANYMLDISITETVRAFERYTANIIKERQREINELSAPIVPIQDGIAVLPLIGSIDSDRADHLLNHVVPRISELKIECLIMDFSGIVTIDTEVASHLFAIHDILGLLGINIIATGIRPDLASRVVREGIDFSTVQTFATVKQAIENMA